MVPGLPEAKDRKRKRESLVAEARKTSGEPKRRRLESSSSRQKFQPLTPYVQYLNDEDDGDEGDVGYDRPQ